MPIRQQQRARQTRQPQQRRQERLALPAAEAMVPVIVNGVADLQRRRDAHDAWMTETGALLTEEREAISEAWADAARKVAAIRAATAEKWAAVDAAWAKRAADSHQPEPDGSDEPDVPDDAGEPDVDQ